ncbi:hypothetical protein FCV25MIE_28073, partial [Fagus crenata]
MVDHSDVKELSSSDETHDDDLECSLENSMPAFSHSLMGAVIVEPGCTAVEVGASDPLSTESTMPPQPIQALTQFDEGESSGVSHHSEEEVDGGSFSGLVRVDLADPLCQGRELLVAEPPMSPVMEEEACTLPMVVFEDSELSSPLYCSPLAVINPNTCPGQLVEYSGK